MGTNDHDISSIQIQLTVARWHLDASLCAAGEAVLEHRRRARQAYERVLSAMPQLQLAPAERDALQREMERFRSRMDASEKRT